jgi:hypothetical protein
MRVVGGSPVGAYFLRGAGPEPSSGEILAYYAILYKATLSDPRASIVAGRTYTITVVATFGDGRIASASTSVVAS